MIYTLGIRKKLLLVYSVTTILVFSVAGSYWAYSNYHSHKEYFQQRLISQGNLVANNISAAVLFNDEEAIQEIIGALRSDPALVSASLSSDKLDHTIAQTFEGEQVRKHSNILPGVDYTHFGSLVIPILESGQTIGELTIGFDDSELHDKTTQSAITLFITAILAIMSGILFANPFLRSIIKPVIALSKISKEVTETKNYSLRSHTYYPDEVGELSINFNAMLEIIEVRDKDLESRFEQAFLNAPIGMVLIDSSLNIIRHNKISEELFGLVGLEPKEVKDIISPLDQSEVKTLFTQLVCDEIDKFKVEIRCQGKAGNTLNIALSVSSILDNKKRFSYAVVQLQDITESRRLSLELAFQAQHDSLTGLANRRVLNQALLELKKDPRNANRQHTLSIMDLDQFKTVNDTCGHMAGDELLCQVANKIREKVRQGDLVVRLGGDEFALLLYHCDKVEAQRITEDIRLAIESIHFNWQGDTFRISVSIGAMASYLSNEDVSQVLQQVDSACFIAKESGRNRVHLIDAQDSEITAKHNEMQWAHRLHKAMSEDHFVLFAQPMFSLGEEEKNEYVEILLRLRNPDGKTFTPPGAFLPAAERYGLSVKLDQWVINHLITNLPKYREAFGDKRSYWINISGASISDPLFLTYLEEKISAANLPAKMINFEITETAIIRNLSAAKDSVLRLKALGCQFSLDDFGSGMSSFGYLKELPVDYIKIDGMFVRGMIDDPVNTVFVQSIVNIASVMGIKTVAEYIETTEVLTKTIEMGVSYAQGFLLARPEELLSEKLAAVVEQERNVRC